MTSFTPSGSSKKPTAFSVINGNNHGAVLFLEKNNKENIPPSFKVVEKFQIIHEGLKNLNQDWEIRAKHIEELATMAHQASSMGVEALKTFVETFEEYHLIEDLATQLDDRRSHFCKDACQCISKLAHSFGQLWEPYARKLMPVFFKMLVVTIKIIADSAHECIKSFLQHTVFNVIKSGNCFELIAKGLESQHPSLRTHCAEYFYVYIQLTSNQDTNWLNDSNSSLFEASLLKITNDATEKVRCFAKKIFGVYKINFPSKAEE